MKKALLASLGGALVVLVAPSPACSCKRGFIVRLGPRAEGPGPGSCQVVRHARLHKVTQQHCRCNLVLQREPEEPKYVHLLHLPCIGRL